MVVTNCVLLEQDWGETVIDDIEIISITHNVNIALLICHRKYEEEKCNEWECHVGSLNEFHKLIFIFKVTARECDRVKRYLRTSWHDALGN